MMISNWMEGFIENNLQKSTKKAKPHTFQIQAPTVLKHSYPYLCNSFSQGKQQGMDQPKINTKTPYSSMLLPLQE